MRIIDRLWFNNLDTFFGMGLPLAMVSAITCSFLCLCLDDSHFVEYKVLSMMSLMHLPALFCRIEPNFYSYNSRVLIAFSQKFQPCFLLIVISQVGLNEERTSVKKLIMETAGSVFLGLFSGTLYFFLSEPFLWLSLDAFSGCSYRRAPPESSFRKSKHFWVCSKFYKNK